MHKGVGAFMAKQTAKQRQFVSETIQPGRGLGLTGADEHGRGARGRGINLLIRR